MKKILAYIFLLGLVHINAQVLTGVNGHPLYSEDYKPFSFETQIQLLKKNKFAYYRFEAAYDSNGEIRYINGKLSDLSELAKKNNITLLPSIVIPTVGELLETPDPYQRGLTEGTKIALQNAKYFPILEIGNETNIKILKEDKIPEDDVFVYDEQKKTVMLDYIKGFATGIKNIDKSIKILVGVALDDHTFFEELKRRDIPVDILGNNRYKPGRSDSFAKMYNTYKKPIWITEFNYPEGSTHAKGAEQGKWVNENIRKLKKIKYIKAIFIYQLLDENRNLNRANVLPAEANYGMYKVEGLKLLPKFYLERY
ncbi:MAG: hypothetical protein E2590_03055 [Chryseobacterium sp.]|nr:hypothetical protein [Chryseobacterium sp.]